MTYNNRQDSVETNVIKYLKKNKDIFIKYPELLNELNFPTKFSNNNKVFDLNAYRSKKIKKEYDNIKKQMTAILKAGSNHIVSQKRILKTSLKILNTKSLTKLIDVIIQDLGNLLKCDTVNCFFTNNKVKYKGIYPIDKKIISIFFREKPQTYLNQNPKGLPLFFFNKSKIIKSYILLKIVYGSDRFIVAMGSKNQKKFTKDQQVDLIEYLIQVIQIKLLELN